MRRWLALSCLMIAGSIAAQGLYKYRDADGNWVYTDRQPDAVRDYEQVPLADSAVSPPVVRVVRRTAESGVELVAENACFCPAEVAVRLLQSVNVSGFKGDVLRQVVHLMRCHAQPSDVGPHMRLRAGEDRIEIRRIAGDHEQLPLAKFLCRPEQACRPEQSQRSSGNLRHTTPELRCACSGLLLVPTYMCR